MYKPEVEFDPNKYQRIPSVAVFKEHERVKSGRSIKVTRKDLEQIADNHNRKFKELGVGVPLSYGHTLDTGPDGAEVPEKDQPELLGWCVNFKVDRLPSGEDALFGDFYLPKDKAQWVLDNLPTRSVEYFPNSQRLHPIALLKTSAPELDLPVIRYAGEDAPYRYSFSEPITYSENSMSNCDNKKEDMKEDDKKKKYEENDQAMDKAEKEVTKGATGDKAEIGELKQQMAQVMQMLSQVMPVIEQIGGLLSEEEGGAEGDLMQPAGKPEGKPEPKEMEEEDPKDKPKEMDSAKKSEGPPVKFEGSMASPTNSTIPSYEKDKFSMNDEALKYKKKVESMEAELAKYKKEQATKDALLNELVKDKKAAVAKELVRKLEDEEMVQYASEEVRQADIKFFETLDAEAQKNYFDMAKVRYQKKTPQAAEAVKYQAVGNPQLGEVDSATLLRIADEAVSKGLSPAEALAKIKAK